MERLFVLADAAKEQHPQRSDRYVQIARRISTRNRVRMPRALKHLFCKHCGCFLPPGKKRVRLLHGIIISTCLSCGGQIRQPYSPLKARGEEESRAQKRHPGGQKIAKDKI
jgi:ribonuclease P protein subunit RPR2